MNALSARSNHATEISVQVNGNYSLGIWNHDKWFPEGWNQVEVVFSTRIKNHPIQRIFTDDGKYWLAPNNYKGHGFTIKFANSKLDVTGVLIKNAKFKSGSSQRATKSFSVYGSLEADGPWELLLEEEFDNPLTEGAPPPIVQTFYFKKAAKVKFLRFDLKSYWGDYGGGLDYFDVNTMPGNLCCSWFLELFQNIFMIHFPISPSW